MYEEWDVMGSSFRKMMDFMVSSVEKYGFWGVLAFSSWPNALFGGFVLQSLCNYSMYILFL